jgi:hypothetical protein
MVIQSARFYISYVKGGEIFSFFLADGPLFSSISLWIGNSEILLIDKIYHYTKTALNSLPVV